MENVPRVLAGRYEVGELIGRGGMAEVFVGRDTRLSRTVAIKVLRSDLSEDPTFHARFHREAQSAAALNHPAIVAVYDTGEEPIVTSAGKETKLPYIVMEYVEGHTVRELLKDGAAVPIDEAVEIVVGILGALEYAHNEGIVHRDIKPGNVMLTPTGQVKVMDFGIARALADQSATMTQTNSVVGTAQYLSPEQARGETVDARSDIYSTGCVLFELLTGRPPFMGESAVSVAYQHVRELPPTPSSIASDIPDSLDRVVMKALAKDKHTRYADAGAFRSDLLTVLHGGRVSAPAATAWLAPTAAAVPAAAATQVMGAPTAAASASETSTMQAAAPLDDPDEPGSKWWIWALLGVLIIGGALTWWLTRDKGDDEVVTMPESIIGMTQQDAREALDALDLSLNVILSEDPVASDEIEEDRVAAVDPDVGEVLEEGATVTLTLSSGPEQVEVPDVVDLPADEARRILEAEDFVVEILDEPVPHDEIEEGNVVSQSPPADELADKGATVTLTLSSGPGEVEIPDWANVNMTFDEAVNELVRLGLVYKTREEVDVLDAEANYVVASDPEAGTMVKPGAEVTLLVATGRFPMPDVLGMEGEEASLELQSKDLRVLQFDYAFDDNVPIGHVMEQSVDPNEPVAKGSQILLVISQGPEPTQAPPPTPDPTDPTDDGDNGDDGDG